MKRATVLTLAVLAGLTATIGMGVAQEIGRAHV